MKIFFFIKIFLILYCNVNTFRIIHNKWKYIFRSFPQSMDDAIHVRIHSMNIKIFFKKKVFIEISDSNLIFPTDSIWGNLTTCQLCVSKKIFWDIFPKIRFHSFVELDLENRLSTHNMVLSLELKAKKKYLVKNSKNRTWVPFWNNRLHMLTKILESVTHTLKSLNLKYYHHTTPRSVNFYFQSHCYQMSLYK